MFETGEPNMFNSNPGMNGVADTAASLPVSAEKTTYGNFSIADINPKTYDQLAKLYSGDEDKILGRYTELMNRCDGKESEVFAACKYANDHVDEGATDKQINTSLDRYIGYSEAKADVGTTIKSYDTFANFARLKMDIQARSADLPGFDGKPVTLKTIASDISRFLNTDIFKTLAVRGVEAYEARHTKVDAGTEVPAKDNVERSGKPAASDIARDGRHDPVAGGVENRPVTRSATVEQNGFAGRGVDVSGLQSLRHGVDRNPCAGNYCGADMSREPKDGPVAFSRIWNTERAKDQKTIAFDSEDAKGAKTKYFAGEFRVMERNGNTYLVSPIGTAYAIDTPNSAYLPSSKDSNFYFEDCDKTVKYGTEFANAARFMGLDENGLRDLILKVTGERYLDNAVTRMNGHESYLEKTADNIRADIDTEKSKLADIESYSDKLREKIEATPEGSVKRQNLEGDLQKAELAKDTLNRDIAGKEEYLDKIEKTIEAYKTAKDTVGSNAVDLETKIKTVVSAEKDAVGRGLGVPDFVDKEDLADANDVAKEAKDFESYKENDVEKVPESGVEAPAEDNADEDSDSPDQQDPSEDPVENDDSDRNQDPVERNEGDSDKNPASDSPTADAVKEKVATAPEKEPIDRSETKPDAELEPKDVEQKGTEDASKDRTAQNKDYIPVTAEDAKANEVEFLKEKLADFLDSREDVEAKLEMLQNDVVGLELTPEEFRDETIEGIISDDRESIAELQGTLDRIDQAGMLYEKIGTTDMSLDDQLNALRDFVPELDVTQEEYGLYRWENTPGLVDNADLPESPASDEVEAKANPQQEPVAAESTPVERVEEPVPVSVVPDEAEPASGDNSDAGEKKDMPDASREEDNRISDVLVSDDSQSEAAVKPVDEAVKEAIHPAPDSTFSFEEYLKDNADSITPDELSDAFRDALRQEAGGGEEQSSEESRGFIKDVFDQVCDFLDKASGGEFSYKVELVQSIIDGDFGKVGADIVNHELDRIEAQIDRMQDTVDFLKDIFSHGGDIEKSSSLQDRGADLLRTAEHNGNDVAADNILDAFFPKIHDLLDGLRDAILRVNDVEAPGADSFVDNPGGIGGVSTEPAGSLNEWQSFEVEAIPELGSAGDLDALEDELNELFEAVDSSLGAAEMVEAVEAVSDAAVLLV